MQWGGWCGKDPGEGEELARRKRGRGATVALNSKIYFGQDRDYVSIKDSFKTGMQPMSPWVAYQKQPAYCLATLEMRGLWQFCYDMS